MVSFRLFPSLKALSALAPLDSGGTVRFAGGVYLLALRTLCDCEEAKIFPRQVGRKVVPVDQVDQDKDTSYCDGIAGDSSRRLWCGW